MRKTYHCCITSHDEVMFRDNEDFIRAFNCFAVAALETESRHLADGFMSSHVHAGFQTDSHLELARRYRYSYSRYFNAKYHRRGRLGLKDCMFLEIDGVRHLQACLSYIMRQGLHHGITSTPFAYPYCSTNSIFRKELGKDFTPFIIPDWQKSTFLPSRCSIPSSYRMDKSGLLLREDIVDTHYVEEVFITPRNFLFHMNRYSDERWEQEQREENSKSAPITLGLIEGVDDQDVIKSMKENELGRVDKRRMTDMDLCSLIDRQYLPRLRNGSGTPASIYDVPLSTRTSLANRIWSDLRSTWGKRPDKYPARVITEKQLRRCLALLHDD